METHTPLTCTEHVNGGKGSSVLTGTTGMLLLRLNPLPHFNSRSWQLKYPNLFSSHTLLHCSTYTITTTGGLKWDLKADNTPSQRLGFDFRRKNSKDRYEYEYESGSEDDDDIGGGIWGNKKKKKTKTKRAWWSDESEQEEVMDDESSSILDQAIENFWILKAFKSLGWLLPFFIISLLIISGPKAFLMALAVPLGQSALVLAFKKLFGIERPKPKRRTRMRRKPNATNVNSFETDEEQEESQDSRKRYTGYQSWTRSNNGSATYSGQKTPAFGGWDELDNMGPTSKPTESVRGESRKTSKGKLSMRGRKSDTPLMLRLLIAVFPFLGSWTKML